MYSHWGKGRLTLSRREFLKFMISITAASIAGGICGYVLKPEREEALTTTVAEIPGSHYGFRTILPDQKSVRSCEVHALMPFNDRLYVATGWGWGALRG